MKKIGLIILFLFWGNFVYAQEKEPIIPQKSSLESIEEHNNKIFREFEAINSETPCGVACPECGAELLADRSILLLSNPPQTPVRCPECGWRGNIL